MADDDAAGHVRDEAHALGDGGHDGGGHAFLEEGRGGQGRELGSGEQCGVAGPETTVQRIVIFSAAPGDKRQRVRAELQLVAFERGDGQDRGGDIRPVERLRSQGVGCRSAVHGLGEDQGVGHEAAFGGSDIDQPFQLEQHFGQGFGDMILSLPGAPDVDPGHDSGGQTAGDPVHQGVTEGL